MTHALKDRILKLTSLGACPACIPQDYFCLPVDREPDCLFHQAVIETQSPNEEELSGRSGSLHFH